jgi:hypothetical protein
MFCRELSSMHFLDCWEYEQVTPKIENMRYKPSSPTLRLINRINVHCKQIRHSREPKREDNRNKAVEEQVVLVLVPWNHNSEDENQTYKTGHVTGRLHDHTMGKLVRILMLRYGCRESTAASYVPWLPGPMEGWSVWLSLVLVRGVVPPW